MIKRTRRYCIISATALALFVAGSYSQTGNDNDCYVSVTTHFLSLDSILEDFALTMSSVGSLQSIDKKLLEFTRQNTEIVSIGRANSRGKLISKVSGGNVDPRDYSSIGTQIWFKTLEISRKSYYGYMERKSGYNLFWCKPVMTKLKSGYRFGGAVAAEIDLRSYFKACAEKNKCKFEITLKEKTIFSNLDTNFSQTYSSKPLALYGLPGLYIKYTRIIPAPVIAVEQQPENLQQQPQGASVKVATTGDKKNVSLKTTSSKNAEKMSAGRVVVMLGICLLCIAVIALCIIAMKRAAVKRREWIEAYERGEM